jgi:hypothetical protein
MQCIKLHQQKRYVFLILFPFLVKFGADGFSFFKPVHCRFF